MERGAARAAGLVAGRRSRQSWRTTPCALSTTAPLCSMRQPAATPHAP